MSNYRLLDLLHARQGPTVVVAGRPASGKTALLHQVIDSVRAQDPARKIVVIDTVHGGSEFSDLADSAVQVTTTFDCVATLTSNDVVLIDDAVTSTGLELVTRLENPLIVTSSHFQLPLTCDTTRLHRVIVSLRGRINTTQTTILNASVPFTEAGTDFEVWYADPGSTTVRPLTQIQAARHLAAILLATKS